MKIVIFGLSISSAWGNGHATLWRGLCRALVKRGHFPVFFERDVPYYAQHRDLTEIAGGELMLYPAWEAAIETAEDYLEDADVAMVTSFCPDGIAATQLILEAGAPLRVFYDLDTPVTLAAVEAGKPLTYIGERGLRDFDLVFSYTGGAALSRLQTLLGAPAAAPIYGSADPEVHHPASLNPAYAADLSYLGTYAADRQQMLERLFIEPARRMPERAFLIGGAQYPQGFPWRENIRYIPHVAPDEHPSFYSSAKLNLSVTRGVMAAMGYCPSGRLFEAAACEAPVLTDYWEGLEQFFEPGKEILVAASTEEAMEHLSRPAEELKKIGAAARRRVLDQHTAEKRALEMEAAIEAAMERTLAQAFNRQTAGGK
ncbi:MAG: glycosyltransferase [Bryobacterales bacterium]|nr:glycosyltransferase [Bryobacterales bacterium]